MRINHSLEPFYWQKKPLNELNEHEWEALCDGCGKCCLHKLEDADTGDIHYTRVTCALLDRRSGQCSDYEHRQSRVPDCADLRALSSSQFSWLPKTCAYRRLAEGQELPEWHYLISGNPELVHKASCSIRGRTVPESAVDLNELEDHIIRWVDH